MKFKLQGFREMDAALGELNKPTGRNVLRRAGMQALQPVADEMTARAPKEDGDLKDAIAVGTKRHKGVKREFSDTSIVEVYVGPAVVGAGVPPQAFQQEFGNEQHGPQAYARPGWDTKVSGIMDDLKGPLGAEIDKATARAQRKALRAKG